MLNGLLAEQQADLLKRGFTRRHFGRITTVLTAGATLPFYNEAALAQRGSMGSMADWMKRAEGAARISGNENPLGPCAEAAEAMHNIIAKGGYYGWMEPMQMMQAAGEVEGVKADYISPSAGSSDPLHRAVVAFTSPTRSFVAADPGYEAGAGSAKFVGAKVIRVPLTANHTHDVKAMVKADPNAGVIYICNPNNPTGTLTPKADIEWALANKPAGSILLLDEAYIHISRDWEARGADFVAKDKDVVVLRTFSKLYGMAGLRAGFAMARPDLLQKMNSVGGAMGFLPVTGVVGATASIKSKTVVPERRALIRQIREDVFAHLEKHNIKFIPSDSNCFMMDTKRPAQEFMNAMLDQKVMVGRSWPIWPTWSRITVGSKKDMEMFKDAVVKVMA